MSLRTAKEKEAPRTMLLSRGALVLLASLLGAALAVVWGIAWFAPGLGLQYEDGAFLVAARALATGQGLVAANLPAPIAQTKFPPLFPALLGLWSLVSVGAFWLKALPVICSAAWLAVTYRLLRTMGASSAGGALVLGLTAAAPGVIAVGANLFAEPLFGLLAAACLLLLLEGRPGLAGACAGLAMLTRMEGIPLLAACMITLVARRRFRDAIWFTAPAIVLMAPWLGWALAHGARDAGSGIDTWTASNIVTALEPGDKLIVLVRNIELLFQSPFAALSGMETPVAAFLTAMALFACLMARRHLLPDLFVLFYSLMLLIWVRPPEPQIAPILPLLLWMMWRAAAMMRRKEPVAALVAVLAVFPLWRDFSRIPETRRTGEFTLEGAPRERWTDMEKFFAAVRAGTDANAVVAASLDPLLYFETARKTIRGFEPNGFELYYSPRPFLVAPDQLRLAMMRGGAGYLALTPGEADGSAPLRTAAEALERGGVLERVPIDAGLPRGYALLRVAAPPL